MFMMTTLEYIGCNELHPLKYCLAFFTARYKPHSAYKNEFLVAGSHNPRIKWHSAKINNEINIEQ